MAPPAYLRVSLALVLILVPPHELYSLFPPPSLLRLSFPVFPPLSLSYFASFSIFSLSFSLSPLPSCPLLPPFNIAAIRTVVNQRLTVAWIYLSLMLSRQTSVVVSQESAGAKI